MHSRRAFDWLRMAASVAAPVILCAWGFGQEIKEEKHWAFQPVQRPSIPKVSNPSWPRTPIDAFVLARLDHAGLKPAPAADRRTLLRRVYLDLIGLPPTPPEQERFLQDSSPLAWERVVDDLLSRPQYGERWARHWLDAVRYAESNGYERDGAKPNAWRYRDYVIDSLNSDKPYDRFVIEQVAGDEMPGSNAEMQIATTFLRLGTWDDEPADPLVDRYDQLDDVLGTTATALMGVTLRCARCHDHKFEPFSQEDYYRMLAVFEPLKRPRDSRDEHDRVVGTRAELAAYEAAVAKPQAEITALEKKIETQRKTIRERILTSKEDSLPNASVGKPSSIPENARAAFRVDPAKRTPEQKRLVKDFTGQLEQAIDEAPSPEEKTQRREWESQVASIKKTLPKEPSRAYVWYEDSSKPPVTKIFRRGDPTRPKGEVGPGLPAVLADQQPPPPEPLGKSTGRRLWLARWLTRPENPLVARVIVNRIWQHHFGQGLVASANDFGVMGQKPVDQDLLDWSASDFVANGWKLKRLHRMILLSQAYQMSSLPREAAGSKTIDSKIESLSHWQQRRLEAEAVRDSIMVVSSRLNSQMAGPSVYPSIPRAVLEGQSRPGEGWGKSTESQASRRSVYVFVKRVLAVPELELLDTPDTTFSCEQRPVSTTGPQALTFLNGEFIQQQSKYFAERLVREVGDDPRAQVERAFALALCRPPRPEEIQASLTFLAQQQHQIQADTHGKNGSTDKSAALAAFCLVIFNTNEFVFVN